MTLNVDRFSSDFEDSTESTWAMGELYKPLTEIPKDWSQDKLLRAINFYVTGKQPYGYNGWPRQGDSPSFTYEVNTGRKGHTPVLHKDVVNNNTKG